jgi:hypothetical protein
MLTGGLGMIARLRGVLATVVMLAFVMMFGGHALALGGVLVMFGRQSLGVVFLWHMTVRSRGSDLYAILSALFRLLLLVPVDKMAFSSTLSRARSLIAPAPDLFPCAQGQRASDRLTPSIISVVNE